MTRVGVVADLEHYRRHLTPIVDGLAVAGVEVFDGPGDITLVAGRADARRVNGPVILVEHGAGQRYMTEHGQLIDAYGEPTPEHNVVLYLSPRSETVGTMAEVLPNARIVVAGAPVLGTLGAVGAGDRVVFATHWASGLASRIPEAGTSWPWSVRHVQALTARYGTRVTVHAHPRHVARVRNDVARRRIHVDVDPDWRSVLTQAQILVVDNSSIIWEAQAVGVPVVLIDHPLWRSDPGHDLRWGPEGRRLPLVRPGDNLTEIVDRELESPTAPVNVYGSDDPVEALGLAVAAIVDLL